MALAQRRTRPTREVNNATLAKQIINEGKFDRRHLPLIDTILSTDPDVKRAASQKFLENRAYDHLGRDATCPTLFF